MIEMIFWRSVIANHYVILDLIFLVIIGSYLIREIYRSPQWREYAWNKFAIGCFIYFAGATIGRIVGVWNLYLFNTGRLQRAIDFELTYDVGMWAGALALIGLACAARAWAPPRWGHWTWIVGAPAIIGLAVAGHFLIYGGMG